MIFQLFICIPSVTITHILSKNIIEDNYTLNKAKGDEIELFKNQISHFVSLFY